MSNLGERLAPRRTGQRRNSGVQRVADTSTHGDEFIANRALCPIAGLPLGSITPGQSRRGDSNPEPTAYKTSRADVPRWDSRLPCESPVF
jgi:hypothetical protein